MGCATVSDYCGEMLCFIFLIGAGHLKLNPTAAYTGLALKAAGWVEALG